MSSNEFESKTEIIKALIKAQSKFPIIKKNRVGQQGNIKHPYADLSTIVNETRNICVENGLCHIFLIKEDTLITTLLHESGQYFESIYPLGKLGTMSDKQAGMAISYAKRYSLKAILGVEEEKDPDDDGWGADKKPQDATKQTTINPPPHQSKNTTKASRQENGPPQAKIEGCISTQQANELWKEMAIKKITQDEARKIVRAYYNREKSTDLKEDEFKSLLEMVKLLGRKILEDDKVKELERD